MHPDQQALKEQFLAVIEQATTIEAVEELRIAYLSKKRGKLTALQKGTDIKSLPPDERKAFGQGFNELKQLVTTAIEKARARAAGPRTATRADVDLTLPATCQRRGSMHPVSLVAMELEQIFHELGFYVLDGPEVETEHYNFNSLNIPADHPAREMQDTYWLTNGMVLRTHTSSSQVRTLERFGAPVRAVFPGRCFRQENLDSSHENTFYQLEGLMVDKDITIANLIAVMKTLLSRVFHREVTVRLRPGFFPFVEPGFELDIQCLICRGSGCATCKKSGWLELLPCGLVHPVVLRHGGVDPERYSGFAFGLGLTRLAMMKYQIPDIRVLNGGDIRVLSQFPPKA